MAVVSNTAEQVEIPHEPGEYLLLRQLSAAQLRRARAEQSRQWNLEANTMSRDTYLARQAGWAEARKAREEAGEADPVPDPAQTHDHAIVLNEGIAGWSYCTADGAKLPVNAKTIDGLDEPTEAWAVAEILRRSGVQFPDADPTTSSSASNAI